MLKNLRFRKLSFADSSPDRLYEMDSRGRYTLKLFAELRSETAGAGQPQPHGHAWSGRSHTRACRGSVGSEVSGGLQRGRRLQRNNRGRGYRKALGGKLGPTPYGRRSTMESFAEAYALFYLDPKALRRFSRSVFEWFQEGRHRATLEVPSR